MKVEKVAKNGQKGQNSQPLSPDIGLFDDYMFDVSETEEDDILAELRQMLFMIVQIGLVHD